MKVYFGRDDNRYSHEHMSMEDIEKLVYPNINKQVHNAAANIQQIKD